MDIASIIYIILFIGFAVALSISMANEQIKEGEQNNNNEEKEEG